MAQCSVESTRPSRCPRCLSKPVCNVGFTTEQKTGKLIGNVCIVLRPTPHTGCGDGLNKHYAVVWTSRTYATIPKQDTFYRCDLLFTPVDCGYL